MPNPTTSLATLRPDLGGSFMEFGLEADRLGFIGLQCLPPFDVPEAGGTFGSIPIEELLRNASVDRSAKSGYSRDDFEFEELSYAVKERGHESPVDDRLSRMYRNYFDAEQVAAARARDRVLRNQELRIAALLQATATFGNAAASVVWSTYATAVPITDVETAVQAFWAASGLWPNAIAIPRQAFRHARNCAQVVDRLNANGIRDTVPGKITAAQLALAFDLEHVFVAGSAKNTANEGQAASIAGIWDKTKVTVLRVATTPDIEEPCIGRTLHWSEDGSELGGTMETYRDETKRCDIVRCRHDVQEKVIYTAMGRIITGVLA
jgi:hypothetical protein